MSPTCWIIAGPNGAGKTTFALEYLPTVAGCSRFINVDLIAAGLSPLAPERELLAASRIFLREIETRIRAREDFAFETTLAGRTYLKLIERLHGDGWRIELIYRHCPAPRCPSCASPNASRMAGMPSRWRTLSGAFRAACATCSMISVRGSITAPVS